MKRRIGRPVVRARLPRSLYSSPDGESTYEFDIPGTAGMPRCSGLITLTRHVDGRMSLTVSRVDYDGLDVIVEPSDEAKRGVA